MITPGSQTERVNNNLLSHINLKLCSLIRLVYFILFVIKKEKNKKLHQTPNYSIVNLK